MGVPTVRPNHPPRWRSAQAARFPHPAAQQLVQVRNEAEVEPPGASVGAGGGCASYGIALHCTVNNNDKKIT